MNRTIIDIPRPITRIAEINWAIDWRGQAATEDTAGGEQIVYNAFPRFVGQPVLTLPERMIGHWRALMAQGQGRVNAFRVRMIDPALLRVGGDSARVEWAAYLAGTYTEPRPQVVLVGSVLAGATSIVVNETGAPVTVQVGQYLSHDDWPFVVVSRSGSGASVTLGVQMLRRPIASGQSIDMYARGVFVAGSDLGSQPAYGSDRVARPTFDLMEWITRE